MSSDLLFGRLVGADRRLDVFAGIIGTIWPIAVESTPLTSEQSHTFIKAPSAYRGIPIRGAKVASGLQTQVRAANPPSGSGQSRAAVLFRAQGRQSESIDKVPTDDM